MPSNINESTFLPQNKLAKKAILQNTNAKKVMTRLLLKDPSTPSWSKLLICIHQISGCGDCGGASFPPYPTTTCPGD